MDVSIERYVKVLEQMKKLNFELDRLRQKLETLRHEANAIQETELKRQQPTLRLLK